MPKMEVRPPAGEWQRFKEERARLEREKAVRERRAPIYDRDPTPPKKPIEVPDEPTKYWVGVRDGSPRQYVTLGNVCFPKYTEQVADPEDGGLVTERAVARGDVLTLRPEQVRVAIDRGRNLVVRSRGGASIPPLVLNSDNPSFTPHDGDVPLGRYVFMVPLARVAELGHDWRGEAEPEPML